MGVTLGEVAQALEVFAPLALAEPWDRPGLQVGAWSAPVDAVVVALDPSAAAVARAVERKAQLLVTHHPLLLQPLSRLDYSEPVGQVLAECVTAGVAVYAAHTNLDRAEGGVNDALARKLGLRAVGPLCAGEAQVKLVVTVPLGYEGRVRRALAAAGAGRVGAYEDCSYSVSGWGTFRPLEGASPFLGRPGATEEVRESRVEAVVPRSRWKAVRSAVAGAHPYEEPAIDVYALESPSTTGALGRVGDLPAATTLGAWAAEVAARLGVPGVRIAGDPRAPVSRAAVCGGSGASLWPEAKRAGAQVLVTGDVKHHAALDAVAAGVALIDAGHAATEAVAVDVLAEVVTAWAAREGRRLGVETFLEPEPLAFVPAGSGVEG